LSAEETFEAQHRFADTFYQLMILFDNVVQVFALSKFYLFEFLLIVLPNRGSIGTTLIDVD
jgi:hypothetical protein